MKPRRWSVMIVLVLQGALAQCTIRDVTESETCCGQGLAGAGDGGDADGSRETGGTRWGSGGSTGRDDATGGLATAETTGGAAHGTSSGGSGTEGSRPIYVPAAARLDCGEVRGGSIEAAGEEDLLGFEGDRASWVGLTLVQTSGLAGHARAQVFDPSGAVFDTLDSNGVVELALSDNGTYAVRVAATNGTDKGDYRFALQCLVPAEPVEHEVGCGAVVSDSIDEPAEADLLTFEGASSSLVGLTLVQTSGFAGHAQARVFNPSGSILHTFDASGLAELNLPEDGTYVVRVAAKNLVDTGGYRFGLQCLTPGDPIEHEIECDSTVSGSIDAVAQDDLLTFEGTTGSLVGLTLVQTSGFAGHAQARVFNPSGSVLHTFDANGLAELSLPEDGTYVVRVAAKNLVDTGGYRFGLQCLTPAEPVEDGVACGSVVVDSIDEPAQADLLMFQGKRGGLVGLTLVQTSGFAGHAQARVFNPSGSTLHTFDANSLAELSLPETGTYVVRVVAKNLVDTGNYRLGLQCLTPASPVAENLACGRVVADSIDAPARADLMTFEGTNGTLVGLTLVQTSGFDGHAQARVFNPSGSVLRTFDANGLAELSLPETGTYVVRVVAKNLVDTGNYRLGLHCLRSVDPVEHELECGTVASDSIKAPAEADLMTFEGKSGTLVGLTLVQTSGFAGRAQARVFNPSGSILHTFDANALAELSLPESGTYVVRVVAKNLVDTGNYRLGLQCLTPADPVDNALDCGAVVSDSIDAPAEADLLTFEGKTGSLVGLTLVQTSGFAGHAQARVFNPSGSILHTFDASALAQLSLPESGTYVVRILAKNLLDSGDYRFGAQCIVPATTALDPPNPDGCGGRVTGTLDAPAEAHLQRFEGDAGDWVGLTVVKTTGFAGQARATVFTPSGTTLQTLDTNSQAQFVLPESGEHLVRIMAKNLADAGSYAVSWHCLVPPSPVVAVLVCGSGASGSLEAPAEADLFTFSGQAGAKVQVTLTRTAGFSGLARAQVFAPSGAVVHTFDSDGAPEIALSETGVHVIRVQARNLVDSGGYDLGFVCDSGT